MDRLCTLTLPRTLTLTLSSRTRHALLVDEAAPPRPLR